MHSLFVLASQDWELLRRIKTNCLHLTMESKWVIGIGKRSKCVRSIGNGLDTRMFAPNLYVLEKQVLFKYRDYSHMLDETNDSIRFSKNASKMRVENL